MIKQVRRPYSLTAATPTGCEPRVISVHTRGRRGAEVPSRAVAAVGALMLAAALLLTACTVGASNPPALVIAGSSPINPIPNGSAGPKSLPPLEKPQASTIGWSDCADTTRLRLG